MYQDWTTHGDYNIYLLSYLRAMSVGITQSTDSFWLVFSVQKTHLFTVVPRSGDI